MSFTGAAVAIAAEVSASDIDSADYGGGSLTATVTAGAGQGDRLSIAESEYIDFAISGNIVSFDSDGEAGPAGLVQFGTLTDNFDSLTIALNANATDEAVARLAQAIQFENSKPHTVASGTRTVTVHGGSTMAAAPPMAVTIPTISPQRSTSRRWITRRRSVAIPRAR